MRSDHLSVLLACLLLLCPTFAPVGKFTSPRPLDKPFGAAANTARGLLRLDIKCLLGRRGILLQSHCSQADTELKTLKISLTRILPQTTAQWECTDAGYGRRAGVKISIRSDICSIYKVLQTASRSGLAESQAWISASGASTVGQRRRWYQGQIILREQAHCASQSNAQPARSAHTIKCRRKRRSPL